MRFDGKWPVRALGEVARQITVGHVGPMASEYVESGIPFLRSQNIKTHRLDLTDVVFITPEFHARLGKSSLKSGDVVIVRTGIPGTAAVIPDDLGPANCSDLVIVRPGPHFDSLFLCYAVNSIARHHVAAHLVGAVQQHFNVSSARAMMLPVPPLDEQYAISQVLGALDEKVALTRRMNRTLEATIAALFRSWFVDFDPVVAKAEGLRARGVSARAHDAMPAGFAQEEDGPIPQHWRRSTVGAELQTILGGTPSRDRAEFWAGGTIPWINSGKVNDFPIVDATQLITPEGLASSNTKLMPSRTTVIAITGATMGRVSLLEIAACANQSVVGVLGSEQLPSEFVYPYMEEQIPVLLTKQTGAAQQHVNKNDVNALPILLPSPQVMTAYIELIRPLFDRIKANCFEASKLVELRDALLPQLLSSAMRLAEAEAVVESSL